MAAVSERPLCLDRPHPDHFRTSRISALLKRDSESGLLRDLEQRTQILGLRTTVIAGKAGLAVLAE